MIRIDLYWPYTHNRPAILIWVFFPTTTRQKKIKKKKKITNNTNIIYQGEKNTCLVLPTIRYIMIKGDIQREQNYKVFYYTFDEENDQICVSGVINLNSLLKKKFVWKRVRKTKLAAKFLTIKGFIIFDGVFVSNYLRIISYSCFFCCFLKTK